MVAVLVGLLVGGLMVRSALTEDRHGAQVEHFEIRSRLLDRTVEETQIVPPDAAKQGAPLLLLLPGRGGRLQDGLQSEALFAARAKAGSNAPVVVLVNGADHSYFHDRRDGRWGSYVLKEVLPAAIRRLDADPRRIAIGGISMGGWGRARHRAAGPGPVLRRRRALGRHVGALSALRPDMTPRGTFGGQAPQGAFDDAQDFANHDLIAAARRDPDLYGDARLWLDVGDADPFRAALKQFASARRSRGAPVALHTWKGEHEQEYWDAHWGAYVRFYASALASCRG